MDPNGRAARTSHRSRLGWLLGLGLLAAAATTGAAPPAPEPAPGRAEVRVMERCEVGEPEGSRCAEARLALGGLARGDRLDGATVAEVAVVGDRIQLTLAGGPGELVGVEVVRPAPGAPPPPAGTSTLALYLRSDVPGAITPAWQLGAVQALADRLERSSGPVPAWLGTLGAR